MKHRKDKTPILYKKYLEDHREELEKQEITEKLDLDADAIIVKKIPASIRILQISIDMLMVICKIGIALGVIALLSLAATVLLNAPLRVLVFEYLGF